MDAWEVIEILGLVPLPEEGGYYRETYRDQGFISREALPHLGGDRSYSTCIYYLITPEEFSALHAVKSTEIFHFYLGDPIKMIQIGEQGQLKEIVLGHHLEEGHQLQAVVPPRTWQGTKLLGQGEWALMGCTVAPGFEFSDFIMEGARSLVERFPQHEKIIREYTT